jgi:DtxR family Mn-dependent transcriptional regulator
MDEILGQPEVDPHGDPIPTAGGEVQERELVDLSSCPVEQELVVARVGDQNVDFLRLVEREGLKPGSRLRVIERDEAADRVQLERRDRGPLSLGFRAASKIYVRLDH